MAQGKLMDAKEHLYLCFLRLVMKRSFILLGSIAFGCVLGLIFKEKAVVF